MKNKNIVGDKHKQIIQGANKNRRAIADWFAILFLRDYRTYVN